MPSHHGGDEEDDYDAHYGMNSVTYTSLDEDGDGIAETYEAILKNPGEAKEYLTSLLRLDSETFPEALNAVLATMSKEDLLRALIRLKTKCIKHELSYAQRHQVLLDEAARHHEHMASKNPELASRVTSAMRSSFREPEDYEEQVIEEEVEPRSSLGSRLSLQGTRSQRSEQAANSETFHRFVNDFVAEIQRLTGQQQSAALSGFDAPAAARSQSMASLIQNLDPEKIQSLRSIAPSLSPAAQKTLARVLSKVEELSSSLSS